MMILTCDPMPLNEVTKLDAAPFNIKGQGAGMVKIHSDIHHLTRHPGASASLTVTILDVAREAD